MEVPTEQEAHSIFLKAREKLLSVNEWHALAGSATAVFHLTDATGAAANRQVQPADYFKIDIPGPGNTTGKGYDWVRVEAIEDQMQDAYHVWTAIKVRPASSPVNGKAETTHFFSPEATSTFLVERKSCVVTVSVFGRNEKPNKESEGILNTVRNTIVAISALLGFTKPQWTSLVKGILKFSDITNKHEIKDVSDQKRDSL